MPLSLLPSLGSTNWTSPWKDSGRFLATPIKTTFLCLFDSHMWSGEVVLKVPSVCLWFIIWTRSKCSNCSIWYRLTCIYHEGDGLVCCASLPTGLNAGGQKQAVAFTASKLYQCQEFVEKPQRVIPAEFFQVLYLGHNCNNSSCKDPKPAVIIQVMWLTLPFLLAWADVAYSFTCGVVHVEIHRDPASSSTGTLWFWLFYLLYLEQSSVRLSAVFFGLCKD